jgi:hypothetical protein
MSGGNTKQTTDSTQRIELPGWVNTGSKNIFDAAQGWANTNQTYKPYEGDRTGEFGASWSPAVGWMQGQIGQSNPDIGAARDSISAVRGSIDPNASISDYMTPFLQGVLNPVRQNIWDTFDRQRANLGASAASANAFGGSDHAREKYFLNRGEGEAVTNATNTVSNQAFMNAQGARNADRSMLAQLANSQAGLGGQQFQQNMTAANASAGAGNTEQGVNQNATNTMMADALRGQTWGMDQFSRLAAILGGLPTNRSTFGTQTQTAPDNSGAALFGSILGSII